ncbi:serine/threonine protein kinase [Nostoc sp. T09]|uniref:serine/threonine protein kinase n=1 Tax=Nostoc sp. T09 TaxID=1932621 RepID=UPI000A364903|nr:serine/threonine-protein kinase [Nostoc sp. T09]OUL21522.1 serine/threonine protein kinase [Nostoc sp. T09]
MTSPPSSNSWNGRFIGDNQRYRLDKRLAGGGMGEVFLAMDTRVGQQVALKLLKDTLVPSKEMRKRFEREIAVCAALQSDHIVKISDCGVTIEGHPFYVMEYLRGQTLRQLLLREKRLSVERTVGIIAQVCKGLQLAHEGVTLQRDGGKSTEHIQVIHRDLKPDNIFLVPTDLGEWVKILDFGVAKIRNESSEQTNITNTFIGTFRYAAPEQLQSDKNLDARADIYSLGLILYEMLGGSDPFGLSIKANNISEASWVLAHAYEPPKPLRSQRGCEHLSVQLEAVVLKCLQKNPNNRFASVEELDRALQAVAKPIALNVNVDYQEAIALHPTVPRPLTPIEQSQLEETMPPSQPVYHQGVDGETILRPLTPGEQIQDEDDTVIYLQSLTHQGSDGETIPRSLTAIEQSQGQNETIPRPQPLYPQASDQETIPRSLTPIEQSQPEGTIFQPRPGQNQGLDSETVPRPLQPFAQSQNDTIPRPQPMPNQGSDGETVPRPLQPFAQNQPEGTIFQPRPTPHPDINQNSTVSPESNPEFSKEGTIFQPRPASRQGEQPASEGTLFQPRPVPQPQPKPDGGTIFQPRPTPQQAGQPKPDGGTIFQPRSASGQLGQPTPDGGTIFQPRPGQVAGDGSTIFQPRTNKQSPQKLSSNFWRILGVVFAIGFALAGVFYFYPHLQSGKENDQKTWQKFNHVW